MFSCVKTRRQSIHHRRAGIYRIRVPRFPARTDAIIPRDRIQTVRQSVPAAAGERVDEPEYSGNIGDQGYQDTELGLPGTVDLPEAISEIPLRGQEGKPCNLASLTSFAKLRKFGTGSSVGRATA